jgi:hypothetical protein
VGKVAAAKVDTSGAEKSIKTRSSLRLVAAAVRYSGSGTVNQSGELPKDHYFFIERFYITLL